MLSEHILTSILSLVDRASVAPGVSLQDLECGDVLEVKTDNTHYVFEVLDPANLVVSVRSNGRRFKAETTCFIEGSIIFGSAVKLGFVAVGYEIVLSGQSIGWRGFRLTPARTIWLNGFPIAGETNDGRLRIN